MSNLVLDDIEIGAPHLYLKLIFKLKYLKKIKTTPHQGHENESNEGNYFNI